ncbi:MAG: hypothetical protein LZT29_01776 [Pantoea stewartii]|uniref:hypothetical protein n=1 Tax=Pantoea stewartii TaxID=66269 RepID=UPI0024BDFF4A|nr:hypothetical protein [Pantoea stewartii]WHS98820.1 MAG: hypothetical protein LZT29_01776 [Pantoea stewartii]
MSVYDYVCQTFGEEKGATLKRIQTGGNNNFKGSEYEATLAAIKICINAAEHHAQDLDRVKIAIQETAFVDDLCIINDLLGFKYNFQAKNSDGSAASWTDTMHDRFCMQKQIDNELFGYPDNQQILVVSNEAKKVENETKIHEDYRDFFISEYVPYEENKIDLIRNYLPLQQALQTISGKTNASHLDYVYSLIVSAWANSPKKGLQTIGDLIGSAKAIGKPDWILTNIPPRAVPEWLNDACFPFPGFSVRVESGHVIVSSAVGIEIDLGKNPVKPVGIDEITTADKMVECLLSFISDELDEEQDNEQDFNEGAI